MLDMNLALFAVIGMFPLILCEKSNGYNPQQTGQTDRSPILDLERRLVLLENQHKIYLQRIHDLETRDEKDKQHIRRLQSLLLVHQRRLWNMDKTNKRQIAYLMKQQTTDQLCIASLKEDIRIQQRKIAILEGTRYAEQCSITNLIQHPPTELCRFFRTQKILHKNQQLNANLMDGKKLSTTDKQRSKYPNVRKSPRVYQTQARTPNDYQSSPKISQFELPEFSLSHSGDTSGSFIKKRTALPSESMVAFHAILTHNYDNPGKLMEIHFDNVITNLGNAFSGSTGTFTCQQAGTYVFSWAVHISSHWMYTDLVRNGNVIGSSFSGNSAYDSAGRGFVVINLNFRDEVWVRITDMHPDADVRSSNHVTEFSGFLLYPE